MTGGILLHIDPDEVSYLPAFKKLFSGKANFHVAANKPNAALEILMKAKEKGCAQVATTSPWLLGFLLKKPGTKQNTEDYAGSIIDFMGMEFLILPELKQLYTVTYGGHLFERYLKKFFKPEDWLQVPSFAWELFDPARGQELLTLFRTANFISADIETGDEDERVITCIGFTAIHIDSVSNSYTATTVVVPFTDSFNVAFTRQVLQLPVSKILQNGKYDIAYLLRYNSPFFGYTFDTINLFHSWYCELPKDLAFITSYVLRKWQYWKDESSDWNTYYQYNAKDAFVTAISFLAIIREIPPYAVSNYLQEFPLVFPCILTEGIGIKCDVEQRTKLSAQLAATASAAEKKLQVMLDSPGYNPGSPPQTQKVWDVLGSSDIKGTGKIPSDKVASRHPLNKRIITQIGVHRSERKLDSSYCKEDGTWNNRIYYTLNPHGTDTGRLASKESAFWCGLQIHNIPRDRKDVQIKSMFITDDGFLFGECDGEQAEARDTAYLSGDNTLIANIEDKSKDFHGFNASQFFGVPYDKIVDSKFDEQLQEWVHKTIDKVLRDLSKRTNHGANYNMGAQVMLDTMGIENVIRARTLLGLPSKWKLLQVTQYLLDQYAKTYSVVKDAKDGWYGKVIKDVVNTRFLVGPTGWTRYCFGDPVGNKRNLNAYVAHPPQSLNAMVLNKAYMKVFYEIALPNPRDFKLGPQIHDSILFQYREGRVDLVYKVKELMEITVPVVDTFGIQRDLLVPVAAKGEAKRWSELRDLPKSLTSYTTSTQKLILAS